MAFIMGRKTAILKAVSQTTQLRTDNRICGQSLATIALIEDLTS
ncbi:MAG: hypothetical protein ABSF63_13610 [Candidatus Bathyarchaeia archaeon]